MSPWLTEISLAAQSTVDFESPHGKDARMTSEYRVQGATGEWEVVIGLEVHAQVGFNVTVKPQQWW